MVYLFCFKRLIVLLTWSWFYSMAENITLITVNRYENINLKCSIGVNLSKEGLMWLHNEDSVYTGTQKARPENHDNLEEDYSLSVANVSLLDEGNYTCSANTYNSESVIYQLRVNVPPHMSMWYNGIHLDDTIWVEQYKPLNLTCFASNSKPAVNIVWFGGKILMNDTVHSTKNNSTLSNSSSTITYVVEEEAENVTCLAGFEDSQLSWNISLNVKSYVTPNLSVSFNGTAPVDGQRYYLYDELIIECKHGGARPVATVNLIVRDDGGDEKSNTTNTTVSTVVFDLDKLGKFYVYCSSFQTGPNVATEISLEYDVTAATQPTTLHIERNIIFGESQLTIVIASAVTALSSFLVFCLCKGLQKARASLSANLSSIDLSLGGVSSPGVASLPRSEVLSPQSKLPPEMSEFDFGKLGTLPRPPAPSLKRACTGSTRLKSTKIPSEDEVSQYSAESENYYSTTQETSSGRKMYGEKDMCIILNMKMGEIYNRWMGTIATSRETNKCVVFTTVTESTARKKEIHWDRFVKRALEMPKTNHLTCIEGIAIDKANFYLINEHIVCDTLQNKVLGKNKPEAETNLYPDLMLSDVMKYATGIMEGMEVIHSFGFLHPGLSLKKVLLTNQGECKLYDFCLSEDASKVVETKKLQVTPSLNHFAPETLLRNEYFQGSDVWSIAVLMWEMMSRGNSPFLLEQELDTDDGIMSPGKPWPERYQQLHNKTLLECWNKDCSLRPAVSHLKESFIKVFEALLENSFYEIPTSDLYTPMNAVTNFGGT